MKNLIGQKISLAFILSLLFLNSYGQKTKYFHDHDGDGLGGSEWTKTVKKQPPFSVTNNIDCDDYDSSIGAGTKFFADLDLDGYGNKDVFIIACTKPDSYVLDSADCDDTNKEINPSVIEVCNGVDDNCSGVADDGLPFTIYYEDLDNDKYGKIGDGGQSFCSDPGVGFSITNNDCNDTDATINPTAVEVKCNSVDENCDGTAVGGTKFIYYLDANGDGFIDDQAKFIELCDEPMPDGYAITPAPDNVVYLTTDTVDVNPGLKAATTQELGYTGAGSKFKERNILSAKFLADIDSFGFNNLIYPAGAQVDNYHVFIGDTIVYKKDGAKCLGYCPRSSDFIGNPGGNMDEINDGLLVAPYTKNLWNEYVQLCDTLGIVCDVTSNVQWMSDEEILWQIEQANPDVWGAGVEQNLTSNAYRWQNGGKEYMERMNPLAKKIKAQYPNVKLVVDVAPIWREQATEKSWNNDVAAMLTSDWDGVRAYDQIGDLLKSWTLRPEDDLIAIMNALDVVNPERFRAAYQKFGNLPQYIFQYYAPFEGNYPENYRFTHFGVMYMGLEFEWLFKNATTDKNIVYAAHWNLKQAWDQNEAIQPEFVAHILYNQMFKDGRKWLVRSGIPQPLRIYGSINPATKNYQVAIINPSNQVMDLPYISFDGYITKSYSVDGLQAKLLEKSKRITPTKLDSYSLIMVDFTNK